MPVRIDEEITFRRLEVLLAFMETGSLSRAAEKLETSSVSVHRALHSLEAGLRCALFRNEGRNLHPNDAAHALADVAREVLGTMAEGIRSTREVAGYSADRIRIGSLYSLTHHTIPALVMAMKVRKPEVQTELVLGSNADLLQKLRDGGVDAALMGTPEGAPDVESEPLFVDDIFFAAPAGSRYAALDQIDLSTCADESFVTLSEGFVTYSGFVERFVAGTEMPPPKLLLLFVPLFQTFECCTDHVAESPRKHPFVEFVMIEFLIVTLAPEFAPEYTPNDPFASNVQFVSVRFLLSEPRP